MAKAKDKTENVAELPVQEVSLSKADLENAVVLIKRSQMSGEEAIPAALLIQKLTIMAQQKESNGNNQGSDKQGSAGSEEGSAN